MTITLQNILVDTGGPDEEGCLVFIDERLAAVLVQLSDQHNGRAGHWYFEAGFGPFDGPIHPVFPDLRAAETWIAHRYAERGRRRAT